MLDGKKMVLSVRFMCLLLLDAIMIYESTLKLFDNKSIRWSTLSSFIHNLFPRQFVMIIFWSYLKKCYPCVYNWNISLKKKYNWNIISTIRRKSIPSWLSFSQQLHVIDIQVNIIVVENKCLDWLIYQLIVGSNQIVTNFIN